jgi:hypothetical protein
MRRIAITVANTLALALITAAAGVAQMQEGYVDVLVCKVKPEKRTDFDTVLKKMADANRRHKGDAFLVYQVEYGEGNTVTFVSTRPSYAAIEQGQTAFEGALKEAFGVPAMQQMDKDFESYLVSSRAELRRRRWDLSIHLPSDQAGVSKIIGESRWLRTIAVHVRPGRVDDFEVQARALKAGLEKTAGPLTLVSQALAGQHNTVYYFTTPRSSLADFDTTQPPLREILGEEGYRMFQKGSAENVQLTETTLSRFLPELSNPPKEIAAASPDFWNPKPTAASSSRAKPKPAETPKPAN